jgi:hypothetical protein
VQEVFSVIPKRFNLAAILAPLIKGEFVPIDEYVLLQMKLMDCQQKLIEANNRELARWIEEKRHGKKIPFEPKIFE